MNLAHKLMYIYPVDKHQYQLIYEHSSQLTMSSFTTTSSSSTSTSSSIVARGETKVGINGAHDLGGRLDVTLDSFAETQRSSDKSLTMWEKSIHALLVLLATHKSGALMTTDELRRGVEGLEPKNYESWGYYERWSAAMAAILVERGVITENEINIELGCVALPEDGTKKEITRFDVGDVVIVKAENTPLRWRRPHLRVPGYIYGMRGVIERYVGEYNDPFLLAFRGEGPKQSLYRVRFLMRDVWKSRYYDSSGGGGSVLDGSDYVSSEDSIDVEIYQGWLTKVVQDMSDCVNSSDISSSSNNGSSSSSSSCTSLEHDHSHHIHEHDHTHHHTHEDSAHVHECDTHGNCSHSSKNNDIDVAAPVSAGGGGGGGDRSNESNSSESTSTDHDHGHSHDGVGPHSSRDEVEANAIVDEGNIDDCPGKVIGEVLLRILLKKNIITQIGINETVAKLENAGKAMLGATLVARAWVDVEFKKRLLVDAKAAAAEIGISTSNPNAPTQLVVVENTTTSHNVIVCTLCSCYPSALLGLSPAWYKSRSYRSRMAITPRAALKESFGLEVPSNVAVRVHDSTADCRYLVLPLQPAYTIGWSEERLKEIITRDSLIGVATLAR